MWARRIDLNILEPIANGFRFSEGLRMFQDRIRCIPQAAEDLKETAQEGLTWLDGLIAGRISSAASGCRWRTSCSSPLSTSSTARGSRSTRR